MTWITFLWPMVTAACITMGLMHVRIGLRRKPGAAHLLFALTAFSFAAFSGLELALLLAHSPARFLELQRWSDFVGAAGAVSLAAFVWVFFATGRKWLALIGSVLVCGPLILNLSPEPKLIFLQITGIRTVETFGGARYTVAEGTRNPWVAVYYLGVLLIAAFVADASVTLWRRGGRRRAVLVGGTITGFILIAGVQAWLVDAGILATPYLVSFFYLIILVAMGTELSDEVLQASQLARDLRETEKRLSLAADATKLGLWVWDVEKDEIWTTARGRALFGFTPTERIDREHLLDAVHPDDREAVRTAQESSLLSDVDYEREYRVVLPESGTRWVDVRGRVERDEAGRPVRVLGAAFDITGRKQSEQKINQQRDALAHVTRVSTMAHLATSLAHELNQPLGAILRNAEAAELFLQDPSPDLVELGAILADIRKDDQRAGEVIDRMRGMLKRREIESRPLDLARLAGDVVALVGPDAALRRVCLALEADPALPPVQGDRVQLQQVLVNLILNAMDAVDGNPPATRLVRVRARLTGGSVELAVSDTGCGIPGDRLPKVFEPFVTSKPNGLGLGLAISRSIVEAHGGWLRAENDPAGGATFTCALPVVEGDDAK